MINHLLRRNTSVRNYVFSLVTLFTEVVREGGSILKKKNVICILKVSLMKIELGGITWNQVRKIFFG